MEKIHGAPTRIYGVNKPRSAARPVPRFPPFPPPYVSSDRCEAGSQTFRPSGTGCHLGLLGAGDFLRNSLFGAIPLNSQLFRFISSGGLPRNRSRAEGDSRTARGQGRGEGRAWRPLQNGQSATGPTASTGVRWLSWQTDGGSVPSGGQIAVLVPAEKMAICSCRPRSPRRAE